MNFKDKLESRFFPFIEKPGRYSGGELNSIIKDLSKVTLNGVLCFPELYDIGMSHFGSQILYHIGNSNKNWAVSRSYMPWLDAEDIMRKEGIPLYSLEYLEPVGDADWVGFSMQYELQYSNLINMLDLSNIPIKSKDRNDKHPIIIAGGPVVANPEPISEFIDIFFIGDGEDSLREFSTILEQAIKDKRTRAEKIELLSKIEGAYVPAFRDLKLIGSFLIPIIDTDHPIIKVRKISEFKYEDTPINQVVPLVSVVHNRMAVEVTRGCTRGCRFCSAGYYYRPIRERPIDHISNQIKEGIKATGWDDISLLSLSTADYSRFGELLCSVGEAVGENGIKVSLPSTRIDAISEDEFKLLDRVSPSSSLTIAPEAGSQRLRNVINKDFSRETIIEMVEKLMKNSFNTIKLYFMVGLPTECQADIDELIALVKEISSMMWQDSHRRNLNVAISPFSPKPHTPFQWEGLSDKYTVLGRCKQIKDSFRNARNVKVEYRDPTMTILESTLTRGDRSLGDVIIRAWEKGARFDGWNEHFNYTRWQESAEEIGLDLTKFTSPIDLEQPLPWDGISMGLSKKFLLSERDNAYNESTVKDCRNKNCITCGVCGGGITMKYTDKGNTKGIFEVIDLLNSERDVRNNGDNNFIRIKYRKGNHVRFLSHRNIVDTILRAFKASKVPSAFTNGFKPRARVSFGPPLPLATMGDGEYLDAVIQDKQTIDLDMVNRYLPDGLYLESQKLLSGKPKALSAVIMGGRWAIKPIDSIDINTIIEKVEAFSKSDSFITTIIKKEKAKEVDLRPLVYSIEVIDGVILTTLSMEPGRNCRPSDLIKALFEGESFYNFAITRLECLKKVDNRQLLESF